MFIDDTGIRRSIADLNMRSIGDRNTLESCCAIARGWWWDQRVTVDDVFRYRDNSDAWSDYYAARCKG